MKLNKLGIQKLDEYGSKMDKKTEKIQRKTPTLGKKYRLEDEVIDSLNLKIKTCREAGLLELNDGSIVLVPQGNEGFELEIGPEWTDDDIRVIKAISKKWYGTPLQVVQKVRR